MKIKVGIVGAAGYTGGELIRLLLNHPDVDLVFVHSKSSAGSMVSDVHTDLLGDTTLRFTNEDKFDADLIFLCMAHGEAKIFLQQHKINDVTKIIDLSNDFRLQQFNGYNEAQFIYGLPELNKEQISSANYVANPGCFATAILLGLLPLAQQDLLPEDVYTTGITGSTGAGQALSASSHFSWRSNNIQGYKTLSHQHIGEIEESLSSLPDSKSKINFIPWRGDFARGMYVSSVIKSHLTVEDAYALYETFYKGACFTHLSKKMIAMKQVVNANKCVIHIEQHDGKIVVHSAIDNLLKGASGQAVQNMNLMFGLKENQGLKLKATSF